MVLSFTKALLPHSEVAGGELTTYGDFAATTVSYPIASNTWTSDLVVANLVTNEIWEIPSRPGSLRMDVMAMNGNEALIEEHPASDPSLIPQRLVRLDLTKLDSLAKGWN